MRILFAATLLLALAGCATGRPDRRAERIAAAADWRQVVTDTDRKRLREWRSDFARALQKARRAGHGAAIDAEGRLLMPDAALPGSLPNGDYRCRILKLGARGGPWRKDRRRGALARSGRGDARFTSQRRLSVPNDQAWCAQ